MLLEVTWQVSLKKIYRKGALVRVGLRTFFISKQQVTLKKNCLLIKKKK
jgi:hypothetical protein